MKKYTGENTREIAFPLSGIGTGGMAVAGNGRLCDWELGGRAAKYASNEYTCFAFKAERGGKVVDARILHGDELRALSGTADAAHHHSWGFGQGPNRTTLAGLAHFPSVSFTGEFPFAKLEYECPNTPAAISLSAFNPFIPSDEDASSLPAAFFEWEIKNTSEYATDYTIAFSVGNPHRISDGGYNEYGESEGLHTMTLSSRNYTPDDNGYGELVSATDADDVSYQEYWYRSGWFDDVTTFWREFSAYGRMKNRHYDDNDRRGQLDIGDMSTLSAHISLAPGESGKLRFMLAWYFPNFVKYWDGAAPRWKHEYCRRFGSADDVLKYCRENYTYLHDASAAFARSLSSMTLPDAMTEAAADNLAVLKSATCLRLENGEFWAFEGSNASSGSCEGTCDHVWMYQYALPFLFPRLARGILETDYRYNMRDSGEMMFRTMLPLGAPKWNFRACVDGQMGSIIRFWREWKLSGDDEWLKKWYPTVIKTLEYAWSEDNYDMWDREKRGVITGRQHHTLDVELFGPCSWLSGYYLAALKACAEMSEYLGYTERAAEYRAIFGRGAEFCDSELFNGRYYVQQIDVGDRTVLDKYAVRDPGVYYYYNDEKNELKYQFGEGCEIDQLVGQWHASLCGLGDIFDKDNRRTAAESIYRYNFKSMRDVFNPCRIFALNDERGAVMCEWPEGAYRPAIPLPYTEECMTGFEYAAAGLLIREGMTDKALEMVEAIRGRYDGAKRNPFAEIECGSSYARSMSSFALIAAYSGYSFDMVKGVLGFDPVCGLGESVQRYFWSVDGAWGICEMSEEAMKLKVLCGSIVLNGFLLPKGASAVKVMCGGEDIGYTQDGGELAFAAKAEVKDELTVVLSGG